MTTYAMIDAASGYFWGEAEAETPIEACRKLDADLSEPADDYSEIWSSALTSGGRSGYFVYELSPEQAAELRAVLAAGIGGDSPEAISAAEAGAFAAAVVSSRNVV